MEQKKQNEEIEIDIREIGMVLLSRWPVILFTALLMGLDMNYETLKGKVSVNIPTNSRVIDISVRDPDPYMAKELADSIREISAEKIKELMAIDAVNVMEEGNVPDRPASPNVRGIAMIGMMIGFLLSAGLALLSFLLNDSICTPDDVERYLSLSVLGSIPLDLEKDEQERKNQKLKAKAERRRKREKRRGMKVAVKKG